MLAWQQALAHSDGINLTTNALRRRRCGSIVHVARPISSCSANACGDDDGKILYGHYSRCGIRRIAPAVYSRIKLAKESVVVARVKWSALATQRRRPSSVVSAFLLVAEPLPIRQSAAWCHQAAARGAKSNECRRRQLGRQYWLRHERGGGLLDEACGVWSKSKRGEKSGWRDG